MMSRPSSARIVAAMSAGLLAGCAADLATITAGDPKALDVAPAHAAATAASKRAGGPTAADAPGGGIGLLPVAGASPPEAAATASVVGREQQISSALAELERGDPQKAERLLSAMATANPDWRVLSGLGVATSTLGRQTEAQAHFKKALQLSPANQTVLNNLAMSYLLDRKPAEAEATLKRATTTGRATRETLDNLALARTLKAQIEGRTAE